MTDTHETATESTRRPSLASIARTQEEQGKALAAQGQVLAELLETVRRAAPLLDSPAARMAARGGNVLSILRAGR